MKFTPSIKFLPLWALLLSGYAVADSTEPLSEVGAGSPFLSLMLDDREDLRAAYCSSVGENSCKAKLDNADTFLFLQSLDVVVNGVPGDLNGDGKVDNATQGEGASSAAADGDADFDGLRDSVEAMSDFSATKIQVLTAVIRLANEQSSGTDDGLAALSEGKQENSALVLNDIQQSEEGKPSEARRDLIELLASLAMPSTF